MRGSERTAIHLLSKSEALQFVRERADVLDAATNPPNPFACSEWVRHFIDQVVPMDRSVLAIEARDGLMLLYRDARAPGGFRALANYYASLYSPLNSKAPDRAQIVAHVVRQLTDMRPRISTLNLAPLDEQAADTEALTRALTSQGWYVRRYFCFGNWYLPCDGVTFDAYMRGRDSQLRNTWARKSKKLLAAGRMEIITATSDVEAAMDAYDEVYARSWKQPEPYAGFVRGWARICARRGWLRLGIVFIADKPIAAQFWFAMNRRAYIFKLAYDEAESKWSAGTVLTAHMIQHALDVDRVLEIDYLTGDDAYKKSWMTHRRERVGLRACNTRTLLGLASSVWERAGAGRAWLRRAPRPVSARR
jgi:hypothetical protein